MNILINILVFIVLPLTAMLVVQRRNKAIAEIKNRLKVNNIREDWELYKELILDQAESIQAICAESPSCCTIVTFHIMDRFFECTSEITDMKKACFEKKGVPRGLFLKTLIDNYDIVQLGSKVNAKNSVQKLLANYSKHNNKLFLIVTQDHVGVVCNVKKNTVIDAWGPAKEVEFNPAIDKLIMVKGPLVYEDVEIDEDEE